jgi:hypothetical protein
VVSSLGLDRTRTLAQAFADQTGIVVQLEELPAEPLSLRLQFLSNQPADIWLGGTAEEYYQADKQRYLQSYQAAALWRCRRNLRTGLTAGPPSRWITWPC